MQHAQRDASVHSAAKRSRARQGLTVFVRALPAGHGLLALAVPGAAAAAVVHVPVHVRVACQGRGRPTAHAQGLRAIHPRSSRLLAGLALIVQAVRGSQDACVQAAEHQVEPTP